MYMFQLINRNESALVMHPLHAINFLRSKPHAFHVVNSMLCTCLWDIQLTLQQDWHTGTQIILKNDFCDQEFASTKLFSSY